MQVKVIGTDTAAFLSGQTDLRGVFVAEGVRGKVAAVARRNGTEYAFYRGTAYVGQPPTRRAPAAGQATGKPPGHGLGLEDNIRQQNSINGTQQIDRLNSRYNPANPAAPQGVQVKDAY